MLVLDVQIVDLIPEGAEGDQIYDLYAHLTPKGTGVTSGVEIKSTICMKGQGHTDHP